MHLILTGAPAPRQCHVYDATGALLIRKEPSGKKTLFLGGDTEVTYTPADGSTPAATTAKRVFTFEGKVVAFRDGPNPSDVTFQPPGYQGTSLTQVDGGGGSYAVRRFDPFGAPRGPVTGASWEAEHGFLGATGATTDATSGLVHLGAREYDPTLGRFLSVDPVMALTDPQQWNAYGYANNNPVTNSDPTGMLPEGPGAGTVYRPSTGQIFVTNQSKANSSAPGGGNGAHKGNGGNSNTGGKGGQGNPNLGAGPSKTTANDRAAYARLVARNAAARAAARAAANSAQANGMRFTAGFANAHMTSQFFYLDILGVLPTEAIEAKYGGNGWFTGGAVAYEAVSMAVSGGAGAAAAGPRAAASASSAAAKGVDDAAGIVYRRTDLMGGKPYIGQAKSESRYFARQSEHARANPDADFEFEIIGRAQPGGQLSRMEEFFIRQEAQRTRAIRMEVWRTCAIR
ncbi:hypothetical protein N802_02080 [Knoellia sinensis KCTC 19936]|uniref:GIY-YIG domain-containing protein n=1 Tax=Knoellia sinensis KCTC 19936 TaxID=1385520 RepID=A0A0A0JCF7_9MICO|nr:RHS repeat-associated core domain-containing protein [Knoellia sinensis]KGN35045.1 hypothetical protein N802_02080 [Knoellia sinensis KCTC 19936]